MTMKERLEIHRQIEAENQRKLEQWKECELDVDGERLQNVG